ncbi:MAG TPA: hypothetical protein VK427_00525, partial [Kofleriaceae bacterium]|nr:hypothetical protein [Kofleriaceae bacterium]
RELPVDVRTVFPLRRPEVAVEGRVAWVFATGEALVNIGTKQHRIGNARGFLRGSTVVMRDELYPDMFAAAELPSGERGRLVDTDGRTTLRAKVVRGKTKDPAVTSAPIVVEDERLTQLLAALAHDPDNEATRLVLVDLLQELGEAYGTWIAQGVVGRAKRKEVLGPLSHFLDAVQYRGGLPWAASLVRRPPTDPELVASACADARLGMLSTLRANKGPVDIYCKLVGSPRAVGLRHVDVHDRSIAAALVASGHTQLTHIYDVRFTRAPLVKLLATAAFDRVVQIETTVQVQHVSALLARVELDEHGFFARAPRRLVLRERYGQDQLLAPLALPQFPALPLDELHVGAVSVVRRDDGLHARIAHVQSYWLDVLAAAIPELRSVEVSKAWRDAVRAYLPNVQVICK